MVGFVSCFCFYHSKAHNYADIICTLDFKGSHSQAHEKWHCKSDQGLRTCYLQATPSRLLADFSEQATCRLLRTGYLQSIKLEPVYSKGHQDCKDSLKAPRKLQPKPQENSRNQDQERDKLGSLHRDGEPIKTAFQANEYWEPHHRQGM